MLRNILLGLGVMAALFSVMIFSGKLPIGNSTANVPTGDVNIWGTIPLADINGVIQNFNINAKTYRVNYREVRENVFSQKLVEAVASGNGPDLIIAPHQIILSQASRIYPYPSTSISEKAFKDTYVDGANVFLTPKGALALPVSVEPMVLFYNRTLLSKHGVVRPPATWDDVSTFVPALTVMGDRNQFIESGIALGAPTTPYAKDILMAMVAEMGQTPILGQPDQDGKVYYNILANSPVNQEGNVRPLSDALRFFALFADPTKSVYSWNQFSGKADDQFVAEKLAMYIGYSGELETLRARNPRGDFDMTYLPKAKGYNTFTTGARLYGVATLKTSKNILAALATESKFSQGDVAKSIASSVNAVPALRAYSTTSGLNEVVARSMLVAKAWHDSFPNENTTYTYNMISDVINNRSSVIDAADTFISRLQDLYNPI